MSTRKFVLRLFQSAFIFVALLLGVATPALAYFAPGNHQAASLVLGQANFTSSVDSTTQTTFYDPGGVAIDPATHKVFVVDGNNQRVLRFASLYSLANGAPAEGVLGQPDFTSATGATTQAGMYYPQGLFVDAGGHLWVADYFNHRVLRFDNASSKANGANADGVLGQPDFTSSDNHTTQNGMWAPYAVFVDGNGRLWVAEIGNNRVLRFDNAASKANGANADGVLGQPNFVSGAARTSQAGMNTPTGLAVDTAGGLWVADAGNNRVLRFKSAAGKPHGANADGVLGQPDFVSNAAHTTQNGMNGAHGVAVDSATGRLYVGDRLNNRILVYNAAGGLANGANASYVLGQLNFTSATGNAGGISAASLFQPCGLFFDPQIKVLLAADYANSRVLMYGTPSSYLTANSNAAYDGRVLESSETSSVGGSVNNLGSLVVGDDAGNKQYRSLVSFDTSALPDNAVIRSVTLKIKQAGTVGTDPFAGFGSLLADIKLGSFGAAALQIPDFQAAASADAIGHFVAINSAPGWYQLAVPAADYQFVNPAGLTQFRIRFSLDDNNNHVADFATFFAGDAPAGADRPKLIVEYTLP